jgi:multidrug efflux pump subunit AcrA (membrane-fusion protein)
VYAPFAGTVVKDWVGDDKFVGSGKEIVTVADISEYTMKARVDELEIKQVRPGQFAQVMVQIYEQTPLPAMVRDVGSMPDATGIPEVPVVLTIRDTRGLQLRPKLTAETNIFTGQTLPTLAVPLTAVTNADGKPRIWVINRWGKIHSRIVSLGQSSPFMVEITSGLTEGDLICMDAEPPFAEGMKVLYVTSGANKVKKHV